MKDKCNLKHVSISNNSNKEYKDKINLVLLEVVVLLMKGADWFKKEICS